MGAWGIKYFDNDDAGDFVVALAAHPTWSTIEAVLEAALTAGGDYLEVPEAAAAVAAAAIVAHKKAGLAVSDFPDDLAAIAALGAPSQSIVELALRALSRVQQEPSELLGLWEEGGSGSEWIATLTALEQALRA
jgi:hypothetical protein